VQNKSGKPILLILNGHSSHETSCILQLAKLHNIIILCLPPHTTHKLQPLDVGVFGPLQQAWLEQCDCVIKLIGSEMPKEDFVNEYMGVRQVSIRSSTIISAFKKSGAWPVDQAVFTDDDYAPSVPYSTEAQDFPLLPKLPTNSNSNSDSASNSDLPSDSESDSNAETESHPLYSHWPPLPTCQSTELHNDTTPSPMVSTSLTNPVIATHFYHDPVLFNHISQLEMQVQKLLGQVKMVELKLQNEK
jgi:hypothetical protein